MEKLELELNANRAHYEKEIEVMGNNLIKSKRLHDEALKSLNEELDDLQTQINNKDQVLAKYSLQLNDKFKIIHLQEGEIEDLRKTVEELQNTLRNQSEVNSIDISQDYEIYMRESHKHETEIDLYKKQLADLQKRVRDQDEIIQDLNKAELTTRTSLRDQTNQTETDHEEIQSLHKDINELLDQNDALRSELEEHQAKFKEL